MNLRQVVIHSPGANWKFGVDFREQPGVMDHVQHYMKFREQGKLQLGGPYLDQDAGGMMVAVKEVNREELESFAAEDPAVKSGLLNFKIVTWFIAMSDQDT